MEYSNKVYELQKVYSRMLEAVSTEDDELLKTFFIGCIYASHAIHEMISREELKNE